MKLFSKRNTVSGLSTIDERRVGSGLRSRRTELISTEARNRLISEIKFLSSRNEFLEWFILFENEKKENIFFDKDKIDSFSLAELGYAMTDFFEFEDFKMIQIERKLRYASNDERSEFYFDDFRLFDLAEIVILFSKNKQRKNVIARINSILHEENTGYQIIEHLITKKEGETLRSLVNIIRDDNLKSKLKRYFDAEDSGDYVAASRISADILNIVFSGLIKTNKKSEINALIQKITEKLLGEKIASEDKGVRFKGYINDILKLSKSLSNDIYDVRHTERSTINVKSDNFYKLISGQNMAIIELSLTTLKDDYVLSNDWETIKTEYIAKYKIDPNVRLTIRKPKVEDPIDLSEIPF